jgi:hypothetical protein
MCTSRSTIIKLKKKILSDVILEGTTNKGKWKRGWGWRVILDDSYQWQFLDI